MLREALGVTLSLALPWAAGALAAAALWRGRVEGRGLVCIGYGYLVGALATTVLMRITSFAGWHWNVPGLALALLVLAATAAYLAKPVPMVRSALAHRAAVLAQLPATSRRIWWLFLALACINFVALVACVVWGLLEPYDALAQWADKAKVWYEYGRIMPFVGAAEWRQLADAQHFWDPNPRYPATVPLLQVWASLSAGRWDESLMNLPWAAAFAALGIAFYGQLRRSGVGAAKAMVCTYLLLSIPLLQINVAVAGMADLFVAVAYGLAAIALWQWSGTRQWQDAALALLAAIFCATVKNEGIIWALTLVPAGLVAWRRRLGLALWAAAGLAFLAFIAFGPSQLRVFGYRVELRLASVGPQVFEHLFVMDNWHLLWYAAVAIMVVNARRLASVALAPFSVAIASGAGFAVVVYFLSTAAAA